jgi:hypothetical protein
MSLRHARTAMLSTLLMAIVCGGCSKQLVGNWKTDPEPRDEPYYISSATFKDDGTYSAVAKHNNDITPLKGTYEFDGMHLKLKTPGKPDRQYGATYMMMGPKLVLKADGKKVTMKKQ